MKEYEFVDLSNVQEVIWELNRATNLYNAGTPIMSDKQWDDLYFKLEQFEENCGFVYADSPTRKINDFKVLSSLNKVEHSHLMLSLDKTKSLSEIEAFCSNHDVIAMAKMDGLTCSLTYINGILTRAETRGNGVVGEDVLHNVIHIKNVPQALKTSIPTLVVDGEVICTYKDFEPFQNEYRNPRNFASGSIRLLDSNESKLRNLSFVAWDVIEGIDEPTLSGKLDILTQFGFDIVPWVLENPKYAITDIQDYCKTHLYPIDGIVFKYNDCIEYEKMGHTEHHFRGGIAYKFYDDLYETRLLDIEWSMGKTGVLTPVAIFEPVEADGSVIERASLHNLSLLEDILGCYPYKNQPIRIYKANQIIPQIYDALETYTLDSNIPQTQLIMFPDKCPCCGEPLSYRYDGVSKYCFCDNPDCDGRLINHLDHFFGKKGLDIKGLSKATFEKLIDWGWVNSLSDVFSLNEHQDEWMKKPGFGPKSVANILNAIEVGKNCELYQFISGISIPLVGVKYGKVIAENIEDWIDFRQAIFDGFNFMKWDGFGPEIYDAIMNFNYQEADKLSHIVHMNNTLFTKESTKELHNMTFVITGKLHRYRNRNALVADIEAHGGKVVDSVSKNTTYLINNDITSTSSKNETAKKLNIPIITEEQFEDLLIGS